MLEVYVDYNEQQNDLLLAALDDASAPLVESDRVLTMDDDGNRCEGVVRRVEGTLVYIEPDWDTWSPAQVTGAGYSVAVPTRDEFFGVIDRVVSPAEPDVDRYYGNTTTVTRRGLRVSAGLRRVRLDRLGTLG